MQTSTLEKTLRQLIEPLAHSHGLSLWGLEAPSSPRGGVLRVYVDSDQGVSIDQCASLSRTLSVVLDVEDPIPGSYVLEVSSPGLERPFFSLEQIEPFRGDLIALELIEPLEGRRKWRGRVADVAEESVVLEVGDQQHRFPWENIKRAHRIYEG